MVDGAGGKFHRNNLQTRKCENFLRNSMMRLYMQLYIHDNVFMKNKLRAYFRSR